MAVYLSRFAGGNGSQFLAMRQVAVIALGTSIGQLFSSINMLETSLKTVSEVRE